jgi:hypothetical protein
VPGLRSTHLDSAAIVATVERLQRRIAERFPARGLARVAAELVDVARAHERRALEIRRPAWGPRLTSLAILALAIGAVAWLLAGPHDARIRWRVDDGAQLVQVLEAGFGALVFLGAALVFLASLELRAKRRRALEALHELRALAHVIDMHQLSKDPDHAAGELPATASSPPRDLTPPLLGRYLEYSSEMLSLLGKLAALYAQVFPDPVAVDAVDDVTSLTTDLSSKIWQKISILDARADRTGDAPTLGTAS